MDANEARSNYLYPVVANPICPKFTDRNLQSQKYILYIGRLELSKGILNIARFCSKHNVQLKVIGEGSLYDDLLQYSSIELLGYVSHEDKYKYLYNAKAFITAGVRLEEFGITAVEAISCGTPVIALATGGVVEIVKSFQGYLMGDLSDLETMRVLEYIENLDKTKVKLDNTQNNSFEKFQNGLKDLLCQN